MLSTLLLFLSFWGIVQSETLECNDRQEYDLEKLQNNQFSMNGTSNQNCSFLFLIPEMQFFRLKLEWSKSSESTTGAPSTISTLLTTMSTVTSTSSSSKTTVSPSGTVPSTVTSSYTTVTPGMTTSTSQPTTSQITTTTAIPIEENDCSQLNITFEGAKTVKHFRAKTNCTYTITIPDGYAADVDFKAYNFASNETIVFTDEDEKHASINGSLSFQTVVTAGKVTIETTVTSSTNNVVMLEISPIKLWLGVNSTITNYTVSGGEPAVLLNLNELQPLRTYVFRPASKRIHISFVSVEEPELFSTMGILVLEGEPGSSNKPKVLYKLLQNGTYLVNQTISVYNTRNSSIFIDYSGFIFNDYDNVKGYTNIPADWKIASLKETVLLDATKGPVAKTHWDPRSDSDNAILESISFGSTSGQTLTLHSTAPISDDKYKVVSYTPSSSFSNLLPQEFPTPIKTFSLDKGTANITLRYSNFSDEWLVKSEIGKHASLVSKNYMQLNENRTHRVNFVTADGSPYQQYSIKIVRADPSCKVLYRMDTPSGMYSLETNGSQIEQVFPAAKNLSVSIWSQWNGALLTVDIEKEHDSIERDDCSVNQIILNATGFYNRTFRLIRDCTLTFTVPDTYAASIVLHASNFNSNESFKIHNENNFSLSASNGALNYESVFPGSKIIIKTTVTASTENRIVLSIILSLKAVGANVTTLTVADGKPGVVLDMMDNLKPMKTYVIRAQTKVQISAAYPDENSLLQANNLFLYEGEPNTTTVYETLYSLLSNGQSYTSKGSVVTIYNSLSSTAPPAAKNNPSRFIFNELENVKSFKNISTVWPPVTSNTPLSKVLTLDASQGPVAVTYLDQKEKHANMQLKEIKFQGNGTQSLSVYSTAPMSTDTYMIANFSSKSSLTGVLPLDLPTYTRTFVLDSGKADLTLVFENSNPVWTETSKIGRSFILTTPNYMNPVANCSTYTLNLTASGSARFQYEVRVMRADQSFFYTYTSDTMNGPVLNHAASLSGEVLTSKSLDLVLYPGGAESQGAILSVDVREVVTRGGSTALITGLVLLFSLFL